MWCNSDLVVDFDFDLDVFDSLVDTTESEESSDIVEIDLGVLPSRKRKRRYSPKLFKTDIRRALSNMFINVLNSFDMHLLHSFMTTYFNPSYRHSSYVNSQHSTICSEKSIDTFISIWYQKTCTTPDLICGQSNSSVIVNHDGSSIVSFNLSVKGHCIYEEPQLCIKDSCYDKVYYSDSSEQPRKLSRLVDQHKNHVKMLGLNGIRLSNYPKDNKIHVGDVNTTDSITQQLEAIPFTKFADNPYYKSVSGKFSMKLDVDKRIISSEYTSIDYKLKPIALSDIL